MKLSTIDLGLFLDIVAQKNISDTTRKLIKQAEYAAALKTLGYTGPQALAVIDREMRLNPGVDEETILNAFIRAGQDLQSQDLGLVTNDRYLSPGPVLDYGKDEADLQTLTDDERAEQRDTSLRKKAFKAIEANILDNERDKPGKKPSAYFSPTRGEKVYYDGTAQGYVPQRVLERRVSPQERLDTGDGVTRANGSGMSSTQAALADA